MCILWFDDINLRGKGDKVIVRLVWLTVLSFMTSKYFKKKYVIVMFGYVNVIDVFVCKE